MPDWEKAGRFPRARGNADFNAHSMCVDSAVSTRAGKCASHDPHSVCIARLMARRRSDGQGVAMGEGLAQLVGLAAGLAAVLCRCGWCWCPPGAYRPHGAAQERRARGGHRRGDGAALARAAALPCWCAAVVLLCCCWAGAGAAQVWLTRRIHCTRSTVPIGANRRTNQWR